jgi:hypothetical protein
MKLKITVLEGRGSYDSENGAGSLTVGDEVEVSFTSLSVWSTEGTDALPSASKGPDAPA